MTMVDTLALVAGPPSFITLSNIWPIPLTPIGQRINLYFDSDQTFLSAVDYWSPTDQTVTPGTVIESGPNAKGHSPVIDLGAPHPGQIIAFTIYVAPADASGLVLRPYSGTWRMPGARGGPANPQVPIRFYSFGGTPPPGSGGTRPGGGGPNIGNWSTYTWAQYNPKQTTYPTP